jgi:hypothetical protein
MPPARTTKRKLKTSLVRKEKRLRNGIREMEKDPRIFEKKPAKCIRAVSRLFKECSNCADYKHSQGGMSNRFSLRPTTLGDYGGNEKVCALSPAVGRQARFRAAPGGWLEF